MLSRIFSEPLMSVSNKHNYKTFSESPLAFPPYFFLNTPLRKIQDPVQKFFKFKLSSFVSSPCLLELRQLSM